jgi:hypothetical protein
VVSEEGWAPPVMLAAAPVPRQGPVDAPCDTYGLADGLAGDPVVLAESGTPA